MERCGASPLQIAATAFVVLFTGAHLLDAAQRKEVCEQGYFATLTVWTLLLTTYVTVIASPPCLVAATLAANVVVCSLYYGIVNHKTVGGTSFLLHGGCALILAAFVWGGRLDCGARPLAAASMAVLLLGANAFIQYRHEKNSKIPLYPSCDKFGHPLWKAAAVPLMGACVAACIAWASTKKNGS